MQVLYKSTRGKEQAVTASMAILKGLSEDGGLFVPESIPQLDVPMDKLAQMTYQETAYEVMSRFLTDFTEDELKNCINKAYDSKFDTEKIAPLHEADGAYFLELFHGATIAFKDMALSILPYLLTTAMKKEKEDKKILYPYGNFRRYRKSCDGRIRRCAGNEDYCVLSEERGQPGAGDADGDTERCQYFSCGNSWKL